MSIDTSHLRALTVALAAAGAKAEIGARIIAAKTGQDTVAAAQAAAPVDTGNLRNSIGVDLDEDGLGWVAGPTAEYGEYVELGTSRMAPQPYMGPTFDQQAVAAEAAVEVLAQGLFG